MLTRLPSLIVRPLAGLVLLWPLGCGPVVDIGGESGSAGVRTSTTATPETSTTFVPTETTATTSPIPPPPPLETTSTSSDMTTAGDPTDDPCSCGFICDGFCPPKGCRYHDPTCGVWIECSIHDQDCASDEKCMPWANDRSPAWNATRCRPLDPDPDQVGEPCTVEGSPASGIDSCGLAELCFDVDDDGNGTCVSFCGGSEAEPTCPEGQACSVTNEGVLSLCLPACDPLTPLCAEGEGCFYAGNEFVCRPALSDAIATSGMCHLTGGCEAGTACVNPDIVPNCETGCCSAWCDLSSPQCPPNTECAPWFERGGPPEFETLGICASLP